MEGGGGKVESGGGIVVREGYREGGVCVVLLGTGFKKVGIVGRVVVEVVGREVGREEGREDGGGMDRLTGFGEVVGKKVFSEFIIDGREIGIALGRTVGFVELILGLLVVKGWECMTIWSEVAEWGDGWG